MSEPEIKNHANTCPVCGSHDVSLMERGARPAVRTWQLRCSCEKCSSIWQWVHTFDVLDGMVDFVLDEWNLLDDTDNKIRNSASRLEIIVDGTES